MVEGRELHSGFRIPARPGTEQEVLEHVSKLRERHSPVRISQPRIATRQVGCILQGFQKFLSGKSHSAVGFILHGAGEAIRAQKSPLGMPACADSCLGRAALLSNSSGQWELMFCFS